MKNFLLYTFLIAGTLFYQSCDQSSDQLDTAAIKEELNNRKIKKISEADILEASFEKGRKLIDTLNLEKKKINSESTDTLNTQFRLGALQPVIESLQQVSKAEIKKIVPADLDANGVRKPEKEILEAYQYNAAQGLKVDDNVQILEQYIFYSAPIMESGELKGMWSVYFDKGEVVKGIN